MRAMKNCGPVLEATPAQRVELLKRIEESAVRKNIRYSMHGRRKWYCEVRVTSYDVE